MADIIGNKYQRESVLKKKAAMRASKARKQKEKAVIKGRPTKASAGHTRPVRNGQNGTSGAAAASPKVKDKYSNVKSKVGQFMGKAPKKKTKNATTDSADAPANDDADQQQQVADDDDKATEPAKDVQTH